MESFLDFLSDNYIYFLIAAGVLTLALIGLLVSGRKGKKKEEQVDFEETPIDNTVNTNPNIVRDTPQMETFNQQVQTPIEPVESMAQPFATPSVEPVQQPVMEPQNTFQPQMEVPTTQEPTQVQPQAQPFNTPVAPTAPVNQTPEAIDLSIVNEPVSNQVSQDPSVNFSNTVSMPSSPTQVTEAEPIMQINPTENTNTTSIPNQNNTPSGF